MSRRIDNPRFSSTDFDWPLFFSGVNETWVNRRKLASRSLRPGAMMFYRKMIQEKTHDFLAQLRTNPKKFQDHVGRSVSHPPYIT